MESILRVNDYKGGWTGESHSALYERMRDELEELRKAIVAGKEMDAIKECCDLANFAMMLYDNLIKRAKVDG